MSEEHGPFADKTEAHYEPEQHLKALYRILARLNAARDESDEKISTEIARRKAQNEPIDLNQVFDGLDFDFFDQVFDDVAYSHTAAASLASLYEGTFRHVFGAMEAIDTKEPIARKLDHRRANLQSKTFWDPVKHVNEGGAVVPESNVQRGAAQILEAIDLMKSLPFDFSDVTYFLFRFRNNALHNGYEWVAKKRSDFVQEMKDRGRESWFDALTVDKHPWTITMSDLFVQRCFDVAEITVTQLTRAMWNLRHRGQKPSEWATWLLAECRASFVANPELSSVFDFGPRIFQPLRKSVGRTEIP